MPVSALKYFMFIMHKWIKGLLLKVIISLIFILFVIFLWNRIAGVQNRTGAYTTHQPPPFPSTPPAPHMESRVCIHKATLHKKIDFKFDYFLRLFTDIYLGTQGCLHDSFKIRLFYNALWWNDFNTLLVRNRNWIILFILIHVLKKDFSIFEPFCAR